MSEDAHQLAVPPPPVPATAPQNNFPKLHNAAWPWLVGKGSPDGEPCTDLDTVLDLTAKAEVNGVKFDGIDIFLFDPHVSIDIDDDGIKRLADKIRNKGLFVGTTVAPVWPPTGGGSAMGSAEERKRFVTQVLKACRIAKRLRELGVRPFGGVRIDSAANVVEWNKSRSANTMRLVRTLRDVADIAKDLGEKLFAEGEICWGKMHSWRHMVELLEQVNRPDTVLFQADMAHTLLYVLGYNAPEHRIVPKNFNWEPGVFHEAMVTLTRALRPWTADFHVAQNDATTRGSGTHDKTGRHCPPTDVNGKLNIGRDAGYWLRDEQGKVTKKFRHICWDGCMFPNDVMMKQQTWNDVLASLIQVRQNHGWYEAPEA